MISILAANHEISENAVLEYIGGTHNQKQLDTMVGIYQKKEKGEPFEVKRGLRLSF